MTQQDEERVQRCLTERINSLMRERHRTKVAFAEAVGVRPMTVSRWLSPEHQTLPNAAYLAAMAEYLCTTTDYLVGLINDPDRRISG